MTTAASLAAESPAPTAPAQLDAAVAHLQERRTAWIGMPIAGRIALLDQLRARLEQVSARWAGTAARAEGLPEHSHGAGEEWLVGPYLMQRNLRLLRQSLDEIARRGQPRIPGPVRSREDGQVTAQVFPHSLYDRALFPGVTAEVWMEPGVSRAQLAETQAVAYHQPDGGGVALVLGAGNVSSIGPTDALYKFFVENRVVVYKLHPVNAYLGPLIEHAFAPLVEHGFLRVVYGGAAEGDYLCQHPGVDEIHVTGSHHTVEAIAFGPGAAGARAKAAGTPRLTKRISAELGNVSAVIVVPGDWSEVDVRYQAENLVSSLVNNAGFNCNATRLVIQQADWVKRPLLLDAMRRVLAGVPLRSAYYPGAAERFQRFADAHPEAERFGQPGEGQLPWTLIPELSPDRPDELCFDTEAFCGVFGETGLPAADAASFLDRAVDFVHQRVWGSLNVTLIIHPSSQRDPETAAALERAVARLRYGTVSINHWAAVGFGLMTTPWGAFPGHTLTDVRSGLGVVHNTLMFSRPQKTVVRSLFEAWPKPPWFVSHRTALPLARALADFERQPSPLKLAGISWHGVRG